MRRVLEKVDECWECAEAENGEEAVTKALEIKPDLVVMDMVMPLVDGMAATRRIANLLPNTPVLMHTLYWSPEIELEAARVGARKTVAKSDSSVLISAVQELLHAEPQELSKTGPELVPSDTAKDTHRRTEDHIRELCAQLVALKDDEAQEALLVELQRVLHQHIENFRTRVSEYTALSERRVRTEIPSPGRSAEES